MTAAVIWFAPRFARDLDRRYVFWFVAPQWLLTCGLAIAFLRATRPKRGSRRAEQDDERGARPDYLRGLRWWLVSTTWVTGLVTITLPVLWPDGLVSVPVARAS